MNQESSNQHKQNPYEGMSRADVKAAMQEAWSQERERFFARLEDVATPEELLAFCKGEVGVDTFADDGTKVQVISFSSETMSPEYAEASNYMPGTTELFFPLARLPKKLRAALLEQGGESVSMSAAELANAIASEIDQSEGYQQEEGKTMERSSEFRSWLTNFLVANGYSDNLTTEERADQIDKIARALKE